MIERRPAATATVRTRRPPTQNVTRRMLRPDTVTRNVRLAQRLGVRRRALADCVRLARTLAAGERTTVVLGAGGEAALGGAGAQFAVQVLGAGVQSTVHGGGAGVQLPWSSRGWSSGHGVGGGPAGGGELQLP